MKSGFFNKVLPALVFTLSISGGVTAYANSSDMDKPVAEETMETVSQLNFTKFSGKVSSWVKQETVDGAFSITISDDSGEILILNTVSTVKVFDAKNKSFISLYDIKEGDNLTVIVDKNTPMTMSYPPQINNASYIIKTDEMMNVAVDLFSNELVSSNTDLMLNISTETYITDIMGSRKIFSSEDIKGSQCAVIYSFATMSIPAQTNPDGVIILEKAPFENETYNLPLRYTFESFGYEVKWTSNNKPIIISNTDKIIEITIGSKTVVINGLSYELPAEAALINGVATVDSSILELIR